MVSGLNRSARTNELQLLLDSFADGGQVLGDPPPCRNYGIECMISIGDLSRRTGVNIETIRYYERITLLPTPLRADNGRRLYSDKDARRLTFIRHARELGFALPVIRAMLDLQETPRASCEQVKEITRLQVEAVEERITRLVRLRDELVRIGDACKGGRIADCQIIEALCETSATSGSV